MVTAKVQPKNILTNLSDIVLKTLVTKLLKKHKLTVWPLKWHG